MAVWQNYHLPTSISEGLDILARYQGQARVVGGGTDLILDLQDSRHPSLEALVDVTHIREMTGISEEAGRIILGAAVTHNQIVQSPLLQAHAACLVESCGVVGGPQVRNVATIGGNVAHALPAADGVVSLMALDAQGLVATKTGNGQPQQRWRPLPELFLGPGKSAVDSSRDLLAAFRFPTLQPREASAFERIMRPQGVALPILGVAVKVRLDEDLSHFEKAQIAVGPAGPVPFRARAAEAFLAGQPCGSPGLIDQAVAAAQGEARLRTSRHRASVEYRREMLDLLLRRVLAVAVRRAQE